MPKGIFQKDIGTVIEKSDMEKGIIEGILTKGKVLDSYGDFFLEESINNFKTKDNSKTAFLLHQHKKDSELGVMELWAENGDLKFRAKLDLEKDDNGNYLNKEAAKIYSLMKLGAKYDMSVGGRILKGEMGYVETEKGQVRAYLIKEFEVWEGSMVIKGAVPGSGVSTFKNFKEENMNREELMKLFGEYEKNVQKQIDAINETLEKEDISAEVKKQLETVKEDFEKSLEDYKEGFEKSIEEKLNEFAREFKSIKETEKELTEADLEKEIVGFMKSVNTDSKGTVKTFSDYLEIEKATNTKTSGVTPAVLQQLSRTILRRAQDVKNIWAYVSKMSMSEYSIKVPRETIGTTEVKFIGETANRTETNINLLDNVELELHQIYALPIFSNKLIATDVVGFVALVLERVAENFTKKISEKIMFGTGTGEPFGILIDSNVTARALTFTGANGDYDTIAKAKYKLKQEYADRAVIVMNRESAPNFFLLKDTTGRPLFLEAYGEAKQDRLGNLPIIYDDTLPVFDTANTGDVVVLIADLSKYLGVTHTNYNIKIADNITNKGFTGYYFETMVGGNVLLPEAFVPIKKA